MPATGLFPTGRGRHKAYSVSHALCVSDLGGEKMQSLWLLAVPHHNPMTEVAGYPEGGVA